MGQLLQLVESASDEEVDEMLCGFGANYKGFTSVQVLKLIKRIKEQDRQIDNLLEEAGIAVSVIHLGDR